MRSRILTVALAGGLLVLFAAGGSAAVAAGPTNTSRPTISGTAREGETLAATTGSWTGTAPLTYSFQWQRCNSRGRRCSSIGGATGSTYKLTAADVNATIDVGVTAKDGTGATATAFSALAGPVARSGSAPAYTRQPTISGTAREGSTLAIHRGSWSGTPRITFSYGWQRCDASAKNCDVIANQTRIAYVLTTADIGHTIIGAVTAKNAFGTQVGFTKPTGVVAAGASLKPAYRTPPSIAGTPQPGQTLTVSPGVWSGATPITFRYQWQRCNAAGSSCDLIPGATAVRYTVAAADVGHRLLVAVTARNSYGSQVGFTTKTAVVGTGMTSGGAVSVSSISLPNRLVISNVSFSPSVVHPGTQVFTARFRVKDSAGRPVSGALVYAVALPYGRVSVYPEVASDGTGWATLQFRVLHRVSSRRGYIVFFVRARKPGENLLAGVSTRRLVQVTTGR